MVIWFTDKIDNFILRIVLFWDHNRERCHHHLNQISIFITIEAISLKKKINNIFMILSIIEFPNFKNLRIKSISESTFMEQYLVISSISYSCYFIVV